MAQSVGKIYYEVTLDTSKMIEDQRKIREELKNTTNSFSSFSSKLSAVSIAVSALAAAMAAVKSAQMADEMRMLAAKVEVAAGSFESGASAMASLVSMSRIAQTSVQANAEVFTRLNQSMLQMGGTQADTLRMTELLGKAIRVSGASAVEAKAAMLQFGQAMGSGKLQGDELRSLMETAPYLMQKLAQGIGVPIGALKKLGEEGKLTADVVANAFTKAATQIEADFQKFPQTLAAVMAVMEDAAKRANEKLDELSGVSVAATGATKGLGDVLDSLADQFGAANTEAGLLGRNVAIKGWADTTRTAISYLVDGADVLWQTVSVLGRNVSYVFSGIGREIGGIVAQFSAMGEAGGVFTSDGRAAWNAVGQAMRDDAERASNDLAAAEKKILGRGKTLGEAMREAWNVGAGGGRGVVNPQQAQSQLKAPKDTAAEKKAADEAKKITSKALAAQAYYDGLVAENKTALEKIDVEEQKALTENQKRRNDDGANDAIYEKAKLEIQRKFATERALLEEKTTQGVADLNIQITTDEWTKIEAIRAEAIRRADAAVALGTMSHGEAERAKTLATFTAEQQRAAISERTAQNVADINIEAATDELTKIDLIRQESFRRADAAVKAGVVSFAQGEADKAKAAQQAQNAIRDQVMSINPMAKLAQEYEQKLVIVKYYEQQMAQAGIDASSFAEGKRAELQQQFTLQRQALLESEFAMQSNGNKFLIDGLNSLSTTAASSISGLIQGTMTAQDALRGLASVVLNEAVGALVQIGMQYVKNALIGAAAEKGLMAVKAANAAVYTTAVAAQVAVTSSLAAAAAFASTAAIPIVGPGLAPAAAAAAATAVGALGSPAIAAAPVAGARQYGGPVSASNLYRINEKGAPEMFTAANGNQYMMPTASGRVTAADQVGGGMSVNIVVNNTAPGTTATASFDDQSRTVTIAVAEVAAQIRSNSGPVFSAMRAGTNIQPRMG